MIGKHLAHYEILELLGAGGMGEVYRARDGVLGRDVAIKVLPADIAADPDRLTRFEREARLLASLNHVNVATVHGLEAAEGIRFIVMELVEGETLADRLAVRGRIELHEALELCRQIALGLEAAHARGIVHRDLKPANVKVLAGTSERCEVKILDFGLAKVATPDGTTAEISTDLSASPTLLAATRAGVIMGTAAYMSPEQARGKQVDVRTDIWALGCILFEMLSGQRAFAGETVSDILAAVLRGDPDWTALPPATPEAVRRLLHRCLAKDPHERLHHIADARLELVEAASAPAAAGRVPPEPHRGLRRREWALLSVAAAALVVMTIVSWGPRARSTIAPPAFVEVILDPALTFLPIARSAFTVSPDGRRIVYVGNSAESDIRLFLRDVTDIARLGRPLDNTQGAAQALTFSPDGAWVVFQQTGARPLMKVELATGAVAEICVAGGFVSAATWGADGTIVFGVRDRVWRVDAAGGEPEQVLGGEGAPGGSVPRLLPDGRTALVTIRDGLGVDHIELVSLETGERRRLFAGSDARFVPTPTGHVLYTQGEDLAAVPFDAAALQLAGPSATLPYRIARRGEVSPLAVSESGWLFYLPFQGPVSMRFFWVDPTGQTEELAADLADRAAFGLNRRAHVRISPDGARFVFVSDRDSAGSPDLYVLDSAGRETRLTRDQNRNVFPLWTPDGADIVYASDRQGGLPKLFIQRADGSGQPELLRESEHSLIPMSFSSDGRFLALYEIHTETQRDVWILDRQDGTASPLVATAANERAPAISPDGRWVAYVSDRDDLDQVYVRRYPDDGRFHQVSTDGGIGPLWSPDGSELYYYRRGEAMMMAGIETEPDLVIEPPVELFRGNYIADDGFGNASAALHPDGDRFLMAALDAPNSIPRLDVVVNWFAELERLAPPER